jgi:tRNA-dihydrouridine synthase
MSFLDKLPKPFFILAPMDDVTDTVFRQIVADCAEPDLFFTEFVNVDGLQSPGRPKLLHKLFLSQKEKPVVAQLWGLKPSNFYKTTKEIIQMGFDGVDINFGCPVKTVIKNGACAAMINNRELAGEIIDAVREAAGTSLPVSVKTRVGFTTVDMSWIEFLLNKKLDLLSIHGRTAREMSKVPPKWGLIDQASQMRDSLSSKTLIAGNGDVMSREQGKELADQYSLDGIMIGRGIFHDPFLFSQNSQWPNWTPEQKISLYIKHIELFLETYTDGQRRFETLRKFCKIYINNFEGASELRSEFMKTQSPEEALHLLADWQKNFSEAGRSVAAAAAGNSG